MESLRDMTTHRREQGNERKLLRRESEGRQRATMSLGIEFQHCSVTLVARNCLSQ